MCVPAARTMSSSQAARLEALLRAKSEHDAALDVVAQCVAAGALTPGEAAAQRAAAADALQRAKDAAGLGGSGGSGGAASDAGLGGGRAEGTEVEPRAPSLPAAGAELEAHEREATAGVRSGRARGRQVGSKNTARTTLEHLSDGTLQAIGAELGLAGDPMRDRAELVAGIHKASGATSKAPKTNLEPLTVATLERICVDRALPSGGDKSELIERIQKGKEGRRAGHGPNEARRKGRPKKDAGHKSKKGRAATEYNLFMKQEIASLKAADPALTHQEAFRQAAGNWAAVRIRKQLEKKDSETGSRSGGDQGASKDAAVLEQIKCGICLEPLHKSVTLVPCQHNFCAGCYSGWMEKSDVCPHCRGPVEEVSRNHTLNNTIEAFLDTHPHLKRDADELKDLDACDKLPEEALRSRKRRRSPEVASDDENEDSHSDSGREYGSDAGNSDDEDSDDSQHSEFYQSDVEEEAEVPWNLSRIGYLLQWGDREDDRGRSRERWRWTDSQVAGLIAFLAKNLSTPDLVRQCHQVLMDYCSDDGVNSRVEENGRARRRLQVVRGGFFPLAMSMMDRSDEHKHEIFELLGILTQHDDDNRVTLVREGFFPFAMSMLRRHTEAQPGIFELLGILTQHNNDNRVTLVREGFFPFAISTLGRLEYTRVESGILQLLRVLTTENNDDNRVTLVREGFIPCAMSMLVRHNLEVGSDIWEILRVLTENDDDNRVKIAMAGGVEHIMRHFEHLAHRRPVAYLSSEMVAAIQLLGNLSKNVTCATRVVKAKGVGLILCTGFSVADSTSFITSNPQVYSSARLENDWRVHVKPFADALGSLGSHATLGAIIGEVGGIDDRGKRFIAAVMARVDDDATRRENIQRLLTWLESPSS